MNYLLIKWTKKSSMRTLYFKLNYSNIDYNYNANNAIPDEHLGSIWKALRLSFWTIVF
jgi:hypothetical protein